jgi:predicted  nucleic acid-binding Zn-ribbon protein
MTVADKVTVFSQQHAALTNELDQLERLRTELPNLESAFEYMRSSIAGAESRIRQGREKLRREWRTHAETVPSSSGIGSILGKSKDDFQKQIKLQQELACVALFFAKGVFKAECAAYS